MKTSDLIKKLQILQEKHGDNELEFSVKDYYTEGRSGGNRMNFDLKVGDDPLHSDSFFSGVYSHDGTTRLEFYLQTQNGKNPKITFRK